MCSEVRLLARFSALKKLSAVALEPVLPDCAQVLGTYNNKRAKTAERNATPERLPDEYTVMHIVGGVALQALLSFQLFVPPRPGGAAEPIGANGRLNLGMRHYGAGEPQQFVDSETLRSTGPSTRDRLS